MTDTKKNLGSWLLAENERLREAIRRLADQDATLAVQGGNVIVTMDATLTNEERESVENMIRLIENQHDECGRDAYHLRRLLERLTK